MINKKTSKYFALFVLVLSVITIRMVFVSSGVNDSNQKFTIQKYNTIQSQAVVGKPIKWVKEVSVSEIKKGNHILAVPAIAKDIKIVSSVNIPFSSNLEQINRQELSNNSVLISKSKQSVLLAKSLNAGFFSKLSSYISGAGQNMFASVSETIGISDDSVVDMIPVDITTIASSTTETISDNIQPEEISIGSTSIDQAGTTTENQSTSTEETIPDNIQSEENSTESTSTVQVSTTTDIVETATSTVTESQSTSIEETNTTKDTVLVTYETPAPTMAEAQTDTGKVVAVSAQDTDVQITDVLAYTNIPEIYKVGQEDKIKIKWSNNNDQEVSFRAFDLNGNGKLDYIEWIVPHLSTQTFDIIFISKAFELDSDKNIVADIYDTVKNKDNNWVSIPDGNYVRVTFENILTDKNDNTIYARSTNLNSSATIEVYPVYTDAEGNATEGSKVATFPAINNEAQYKVLLTNLQTPTDIFDLKVIGGSIDFDYIVDPICSTATDDPLYTVCTYTSSGELFISENTNADILVVGGGGGGGGGNIGAGGGAGGLIYSTGFSLATGTYNITVGGRGTPGDQISAAGNGGASSIDSLIVAAGGGGGGSQGPIINGANGGSGGGGSYNGIRGAAGLGTPGQGNDGGMSGSITNILDYPPGGGGGAGGVGQTPASNNAPGGNGGIGLAYSISGVSTYYAGGGGAGADLFNSYGAGTGGLGGGGNGGTLSATDGVANTGGGGGGISHSHGYGGWGGTGIVIVRYLTPTITNPSQITSWTDLNNVRNDLDQQYELTVNLCSPSNPGSGSTCSSAGYTGVGDSWVPIGTNANRFIGKFNGNGYTISDLVVNQPSLRYVGLFGFIENAIISNLGLLSLNVVGAGDVGGLVGYMQSGTISNSYTEGAVGSSVRNVGGFLGFQNGGAISNSYSTVNVTTTISSFSWGMAGGFVGDQNFGTITTSHSSGAVVDTSQRKTGGFAGGADGTITNSYSTGDVTAAGQQVGGFAGSSNGTISGSYATGDVNSSGVTTAGFIGYQIAGTISSSYSTGDVTSSGSWGIGGFGGETDGNVNTSYSTGNVTAATSDEVGGFIGESDGGVTNCYGIGSVIGNDQVGGLVGRQWAGTITNSFSKGSVTGVSNTGGLVGQADGTVSNSFWDTTTSGKSVMCGLDNGSSCNDTNGKATADMKNISTYSSWSIATTSTTLNINYPYLGWQISNGSYTWLLFENSLQTISYTISGSRATYLGSLTQTVNYGGDGTPITVIPNPGYYFVDWSDASTSNPRTDTNVTGGIFVRANLATSSYTLSYTAGANGTLTGSTTQLVASGGNGTAVTAVSNSGYHFSSWSDAATTNPRTDTNVTGNISVSANFEANSEDGGGSGGGGIPESSCLGDKCPCDPHGDINKDGKINLKDFSILMYYWGQTPPTNPCADINEDGTVNLKDFSIMLYWWTN